MCFACACRCFAVGFGGRSRASKGFRRFYTQGCRDFYTAFAIYLQGFRRFSVCRRLLGSLGSLGSLLWAVTVVITAIIVT